MKYTSRGQIKVHDQQLVNQVSQDLFAAARNRKSFIWGFIYNTLFFLIGVGAYISRCFLRKNIGERTTGFFTILLVYPLIWLVSAIYRVWPSLIAREEIASSWTDLNRFDGEVYNRVYFFLMVLINPDIEGSVTYLLLREFADHKIASLPFNLQMLWYLIILISIIYAVRIIRRNRKNEVLYSFYRGDSCFFESLEGKKVLGIEITATRIWMIIEPFFIILLSYLIKFGWGLDELALILRISAFCLFLEELRVYSENRNMILDIKDSNIDAIYISSIQTEHQSDSNSSKNDELVGRAIVE